MTGLSAKLLGAADDEGESSAQDLKVKLAEVKFQLQRQGAAPEEQRKLMQDTEAAITQHSMTQVYQHFCDTMGWQVDSAALDKMQAANEARLREFDEQVERAEANDGDEEVRAVLLRKADYLCDTGSRDAAWAAYDAAALKSPSPATKLTIAFAKVRREVLYSEWGEVKAQLDGARDVCDKGGDWEKKNRLMVYEGMYSLAQRQFERAADRFLDAVATFTAAELFPYERCVFYAVVAAVITLPRPDLKKRVVDAPEVLTVLHKLPAAKALLHSLFYCRYNEFFPALLSVADELEADALLAPHARYFLREARAAAYSQYLASYKAVTVAAMAAAFGVSPAFLDSELAEFIVAGRLSAAVDKVNGVVEAAGARARAAECNRLLKDGDHLLHRLQQLSKIVDVE